MHLFHYLTLQASNQFQEAEALQWNSGITSTVEFFGGVVKRGH